MRDQLYNFIDDVNEFKKAVEAFENGDYDNGYSYGSDNSYIEDALNEGCILAKSKNKYKYGGTDSIILQCKDHNGDNVRFYQALYGDTRSNTFMETEDIGEINRCNECDGIDIWDKENLIKHAYVCGNCGKPVPNQHDLHYVLYAGAECPDCAGKSWDYIHKKEKEINGYWTH